jgi:serine phosphatase RsbU (regulator of sigma subunit)
MQGIENFFEVSWSQWMILLGLVALGVLLSYFWTRRTVGLVRAEQSLNHANLQQAIVDQEQKNEELTHRLNETVTNLRMLINVGRQITATLDFENIFHQLYDQVNQTMDATFFGVHLYYPEAQQLVCKFNIEKNVRLPEVVIDVNDKDRLGSWCVLNRREIIIRDYFVDYKYYISAPVALVGDVTRSIIYIPLIVEDRVIGDLTVQSFHPNAYNEIDLEILRTLASFTAVALDNAIAYEKLALAQKELEQQKHAVEEANAEVQQQNQQLAEVNRLFEQQNEAIVDSIIYAKRIQEAILPPPSVIEQTIPHAFIFYTPREIVSGDFFWIAQHQDWTLVAAVDCTGHGVPGAFMSVLGSTMLDHIVNARGIIEPDKILFELNKSVIHALKQSNPDTEIFDGMDVCLCAYHPAERVLHYAGANRPLFAVMGGKQITFKGTKSPVGGRQDPNTPYYYTGNKLEYQPGDMVYLTTDGLLDQFGGKNKEKYLSRRFQELTQEIAHHSVKSQRQLIEQAYMNWKGNLKQLDDILVIGIQLQ